MERPFFEEGTVSAREKIVDGFVLPLYHRRQERGGFL